MSQPTSSLSEQKPWFFHHFGQAGSSQDAQGHQLFPASGEEIQRVANWYARHPVKGLVLKTVTIIHNPQMARGFESRIALLEKRHGNAAFAPKWETESADPQEKELRARTCILLKKMSSAHLASEHPHVSLLPLWHGTKPQLLASVFQTGYANLATTDEGYFGKGLYNAGEAEYAYRVYSQGALVVNWVAFYSAFPVICEDMKKLEGKGNHQNYDAHFAPVVPKDPSNPHEVIYYPWKTGQNHVYTELVAFDSAQVLPRYLVELQPALPASLSSSSSPPLMVDDLLEALLSYQETLPKEGETYKNIDSKISAFGTQNRALNEKESAVYHLAKRITGGHLKENQKVLFDKKMLGLLQELNEKEEVISPSEPQQQPQLPAMPSLAASPPPLQKPAYPLPLKELRRFSGWNWGVSSLVVLPDGSVVSGDNNNYIKLWNLSSGEPTHTLQASGRREDGISSLALLSEKVLASGHLNRTVKLWDLSIKKQIRELGEQGNRNSSGYFIDHINAICSVAGNLLMSGSQDGITLWDLRLAQRVRVLKGHSATVNALAILQNGILASGSSDDTIKLWDYSSGKCIRTITTQSNGVEALIASNDDTLISSGCRTKVNINPSGTISGKIISATVGSIKSWRISSGECIRTISGHSPQEVFFAPVHALATLPNGTLVSGGDSIAFDKRGRNIKLWDVSSAKCLHTLEGHPSGDMIVGGVSALAALPDGKLASGGCGAASLKIWGSDPL